MAIEANLLGSNTASLPKDFLFTAVRLVDLLVVTCLFTVLWAIYIYIRYRRVVQALNYLTGTHTLLSKPSLTAFLLSEILFINTKDIWPWHYNWASPYMVVDTHVSLSDRHTSSLPAIWPRYHLPLHNPARAGGARVHCGSTGNQGVYRVPLTVALHTQALLITPKQDIGNNRTSFPKPSELYDAISPFGPNVLAAEGDEWKAQRKVVSRCFGEHNNRLFWQETCRAVLELFEYWSDQGGGIKIDVPHVLDTVT